MRPGCFGYGRGFPGNGKAVRAPPPRPFWRGAAAGVFAQRLGIPSDLAGAAGAAAGIAGGYRRPLTAKTMVLGVGGPDGAKVTSLATVAVAALSGLLTARAAKMGSRLRCGRWWGRCREYRGGAGGLESPSRLNATRGDD